MGWGKEQGNYTAVLQYTLPKNWQNSFAWPAHVERSVLLGYFKSGNIYHYSG